MAPLWWEAGTLADFARWRGERLADDAKPIDALVCSVLRHRHGRRLQRAAVRRRFLQACKPPGAEHVATLTIHHGRHAFIAHALAGGWTVAEVRAMAGHASLAVTSANVHIAVNAEEGPGDLFGIVADGAACA